MPVYSNSVINYSYPLNNDYLMLHYTANTTYTSDPKHVTNDNHYVEHNYGPLNGTYVTEVKESCRIPIEWKLTSITGPDYVEVGSNGFDADEFDPKYGYHVNYKKLMELNLKCIYLFLVITNYLMA